MAALVVLGVSIWILVDQPSFLKVLNVTDDVVGGFDVSNQSYFHTNIMIFSLYSVNITRPKEAVQNWVLKIGDLLIRGSKSGCANMYLFTIILELGISKYF